MRSKKLVLVLIVAIGIVGAAFAQDEPKLAFPVLPLSPEVTAQGGSFTANAHGYNSLFTNPAGFARKGGSLTIVTGNLWGYLRPSDQLFTDLDAVDSAATDEESAASTMDLFEHQIVGYRDESGAKHNGNGLGGGTSVGIGFVGGGLGLGLVGTADAFLSGETLLGTRGYIRSNVSFIGGLAFPFELAGIKLYAGGDVRYFIQTNTEINTSTAAALLPSLAGGANDPMTILNGVPTLDGYGLGFDLGLIAEAGPLSLGVSARDLFGTKVDYAQHSVGELMDSLSENSNLPEPAADDPTPAYSVPTAVNVGVAYHPQFGAIRFLFDPVFHAEVSDVFGAFSDNSSIWTHLHLGTEVKLLSFLKFRAGLNQGYVTLGAGMKLLFIDVNASVFTREMSIFSGEKPSTGMSVEAALRF